MASGGQAIKDQNWDSPKGPSYLQLAILDIGRKETNDKAYLDNLILTYTGNTVDVTDVPWCAHWLNAMLEKSKYRSPKSGMARSYLKWGKPISKDDWKEGDVVVFWRGTRNDGVTGHVALLLTWDDDFVYCLGGNQGDKVCIQKFSRGKILGVRRYKCDLHVPEWSTVTTAAGSAGAVIANSTDKVVENSDSAKSLVEQALSYFPQWQTMLACAVIFFGVLVIIQKIRSKRT